METSIYTHFEKVNQSLNEIARAEECLTALKNNFIKNRKKESAFDYRMAVAQQKTIISVETRRAWANLNQVANFFGAKLEFEPTDLEQLKSSIIYFNNIWKAMAEGAKKIGFYLLPLI